MAVTEIDLAETRTKKVSAFDDFVQNLPLTEEQMYCLHTLNQECMDLTVQLVLAQFEGAPDDDTKELKKWEP